MLYPNLFSPITIRGKTYRNRILAAPLGAEIPNEGNDGKMSDQAIGFYRRVAAGGCARVMSGENDIIYGGAVHGMYPFCEGNPTEAFKESFRRFAQACHDEGALAFTSFSHMGVFGRCRGADAPRPPETSEQFPKTGLPPAMVSYVPTDRNGVPYPYPDRIYGPSEMILDEPYDGYSQPSPFMGNHNGTHVHAVTPEQMNEFADALAHCAAVAKEVGLDGIHIHSGHGFMFAPWISEHFNRRTDEYGGSFENRCRFPIMVLQRVREAVGDDFIIELRWSGEENARPLTEHEAFEHMIGAEDTVRFFRELDKYPGLVDVAHISAGLHHNALYNSRTISNFYFPEGLNLEVAAKVKAAVKHIKVGVIGGMTDPALCEAAVADGKVDFVIMARQLLIADPEFPRKAEQGRPEDINNCLRCSACRANGHCTVNPVNLMTADDEACRLPVDRVGKKLVVVGGGIGGMKAAEYGARRGFDVTLFEKEPELGGILRYTDHDPDKTTLKRYKDNVVHRLHRLNVDIRLNCEAKPDTVAAQQPDAVIVAVGGTPAQRRFPCEEGSRILDVTTAYLREDQVGSRVVVVGAGLSGCEAAIHWGKLGRKVTLLSRSPKILRKFAGSSPFASVETYLVMLEKAGVEVLRGYACRRVCADGVIAEGAQGEILIPADTVIDAGGIDPAPEKNTAFIHALSACAVIPIGDSVNPALVGDATWAAWQAVRSL